MVPLLPKRPRRDAERNQTSMQKLTIGWLVTALLLLSFSLTAADGPGQASDPTRQLIEIRAATARYLDIAQAIADGYRQVTEMIPYEGYHFYSATAPSFTLSQPSVLLYVRSEHGWELVAVEYGIFGERPSHPPFAGAWWSPAAWGCVYENSERLDLPAEGVCPRIHPETRTEIIAWGPGYWRVRFWWYPNPYGLFISVNPYLAPFNPPQSMDSPTRAYSEANHFIAGAALLVVGLLALLAPMVPAWRGRAALLWPGFLLALVPFVFVRSDPDVWPLGPIGFFESFGYPEYVMHRIAVLVLLLIASTELLRGLNRLAHPAWRLLFPGAAMLGGLLLLVHVHDELETAFFQHILQEFGDILRLHVADRIYLQHVGMGVVTLAAAAVKLFQETGRWSVRYTAVLWPVFLAILGLQLMLYTEG